MFKRKRTHTYTVSEGWLLRYLGGKYQCAYHASTYTYTFCKSQHFNIIITFSDDISLKTLRGCLGVNAKSEENYYYFSYKHVTALYYCLKLMILKINFTVSNQCIFMLHKFFSKSARGVFRKKRTLFTLSAPMYDLCDMLHSF